MGLDTDVLKILYGMYSWVLSGRLPLSDGSPSIDDIREEVRNIKATYAQFEEVLVGTGRFHENYLEERYFISLWQKSLYMSRQCIQAELGDTSNGPRTITSMITALEQKAAALPEKVLQAAGKGSLSSETLLLLEERWIRLEQVVEYRVENGGAARIIESW
jgi:hypothetical protein